MQISNQIQPIGGNQLANNGNGNNKGKFTPAKIFLWLQGFFLNLWEMKDSETDEIRYTDADEIISELGDQEDGESSNDRN